MAASEKASGGLAAAVEAAVPLSYARFSWGGRQAAAARVTTGAWRMRTPRPRDLGHSKQPMETKAIYEARSRRWCPRALVAARPAAVLVIPFISEFAFRYPPHIRMCLYPLKTNSYPCYIRIFCLYPLYIRVFLKNKLLPLLALT